MPWLCRVGVVFFNDGAPTEVYTLSLHDALPISQPHDDMHNMTIAEAAQSGKPTLILFAAPGFCPSFTCGPNLEIAQALEEKYRDKVNFIHIETPNTIQDHRHTLPVEPTHRQNPGHYGILLPDTQ